MSVKLCRYLLIACLYSTGVLACDEPDNCIESGTWEFGVAFGAGVRTSPMNEGDDVPLAIIFDVAWYGDNAYLDNSELGYQIQWSNDWAFETFVALNRERQTLSFWNASDLLVTPEFTNSAPTDEPDITRTITVDDIKSRDWSFDAGVRAHWYRPNGEWRFMLATDASGVHNGHRLRLDYQHHWQINDWRISALGALNWKSDNLIDYYYGVRPQDTNSNELLYVGQGGLQPEAGIYVSKPFAAGWRWRGFVKGEWFNSGMTDSPLVAQRYRVTAFLGLSRQF